MQLEIIVLTEVSQKKERQIMYDITFMWNLKYGANEPIYEAETDSDVENLLVVTKGVGEGRDGLGVWDYT